MPTYVTPTTPIDLLGAVNCLLIASGAAPLTTLDQVATHADAIKAMKAISDCAVQMQQEKWHFNTENGVPFTADGTGAIALPANILRIRAGSDSDGEDAVQRGLQLYDRANHSFNWGAGSVVYCDVAYALEFSQMIPAARWYVTCLAGRRFVGTEVVAQGAYQFSDRETQAARQQLELNDSEVRNAPMDQVSPHIMRMKRR